MTVIYLANDKYYAELTQQYNPGDTTIYLTTPPDYAPTILVAGKGTANETVFTCTGKTINSITGVARLKGASIELLTQTPITCLNNSEFLNQYKTFLGINWTGAWSGATTYVDNDGVSYNGSSYVVIQGGINHLPTDTAYWQVVGVVGATGATGVKGEDGLGVPPGGDTDQILTKVSGDDNDTAWVTPAPGSDVLQVQIFS